MRRQLFNILIVWFLPLNTVFAQNNNSNSYLSNFEDSLILKKSKEKLILQYSLESLKLRQSIDSIETEISKLSTEKRSVFGVALSIGGRYIVNETEGLESAYLSPADTTLQIEHINPSSFLMSVMIVAQPWIKRDLNNFWNGVTFLIHFPIAEINGVSDSFFNKRSSGGLGFAYEFGSSNFYCGGSFDMVIRRRLKKEILNNYSRMVIPDGHGNTLTTLEDSNDDYFIDEFDLGLSFWFIMRLNALKFIAK